MKVKYTTALLVCLISVAVHANDKYDAMTTLREKVLSYRDKRVEACIQNSPLNSVAKQCRKESKVQQIQEEALHSSRNCERYYRRGTEEQLDCKIKVYQDALDSMDNNTPYKGWQAPDGSSKPSKKNTFSQM
jgi:hypothetical protein